MAKDQKVNPAGADKTDSPEIRPIMSAENLERDDNRGNQPRQDEEKANDHLKTRIPEKKSTVDDDAGETDQ